MWEIGRTVLQDLNYANFHNLNFANFILSVNAMRLYINSAMVFLYRILIKKSECVCLAMQKHLLIQTLRQLLPLSLDHHCWYLLLYPPIPHKCQSLLLISLILLVTILVHSLLSIFLKFNRSVYREFKLYRFSVQGLFAVVCCTFNRVFILV